MNKSELVKKMSDKLGMTQVEVRKLVDMLLEEITESLIEGKRIEVRNFGVFEARWRSEKVGRNVKKNIPVPIPAQRWIFFRAGRNVLKALNGTQES